MTKKTITETVEVTDFDEVETTLTFCDGCGMECGEYTTLVDVDTFAAENTFAMSAPRSVKLRQLEFILSDHRTDYHFCPDCKTGIEEHQSIPASLAEAPDSEPVGVSRGSDPAGAMFIRCVSVLSLVIGTVFIIGSVVDGEPVATIIGLSLVVMWWYINGLVER